MCPKEDVGMIRVLIDTDPGIDDALALFLALALPDVQVEAVTTVSGNVPVQLTTRNALALLELAKRSDIVVAHGSERPLLRAPVFAEYVHGQNGIGNVLLPDPQQASTRSAVETIIQKILQAPGEVTLVALGPLTNIALAVRCEPRLVQSVREVVIMGGALRVPGNASPAAEFNMFGDPHAAHIVLHAGWPLRLVSLDVTNQTVIQSDQFATLAANGHPVTQSIKSMVDYYLNAFGKPRGISAFPMHDPLCLAAAIHPDLFMWKKAYVDIELSGTLTLGGTTAYFEGMEDLDPSLAHARPSNVLASTTVNREQFTSLFLTALASHYTTS